jgi:hypothetical protein
MNQCANSPDKNYATFKETYGLDHFNQLSQENQAQLKGKFHEDCVTCNWKLFLETSKDLTTFNIIFAEICTKRWQKKNIMTLTGDEKAFFLNSLKPINSSSPENQFSSAQAWSTQLIQEVQGMTIADIVQFSPLLFTLDVLKDEDFSAKLEDEIKADKTLNSFKAVYNKYSTTVSDDDDVFSSSLFKNSPTILQFVIIFFEKYKEKVHLPGTNRIMKQLRKII